MFCPRCGTELEWVKKADSDIGYTWDARPAVWDDSVHYRCTGESCVFNDKEGPLIFHHPFAERGEQNYLRKAGDSWSLSYIK